MFGQNLRLGSPWPRGDNPWLGIRLSGCDFADEEKKQLSRYLGSMLRREPTEEEAEQQRVVDNKDKFLPKDGKLIEPKED